MLREYRAQKRKSKGNWDAHVKEPNHITISTIDPRKKRNKKGGMNFNIWHTRDTENLRRKRNRG